MKKNEKGFTLLETLIVSTVVVSTLIYLFTQISNVKTNYDISFRYNTIPGLFSAKNIVNYMKESGYSSLIYALNSDTTNEFIEIENNSSFDMGNNDYYLKLKEEANVKKILFIKDDVASLKEKIKACYDSDTTNNTLICNQEEEMKKFIRNLYTDSLPNTYRIVVEYNDLTFASIEIG